MPIGIPSGLWMSIPARADWPSFEAVSERKSIGFDGSGVGIARWRPEAPSADEADERDPGPLAAELCECVDASLDGIRPPSGPSSFGDTLAGGGAGK